MATQLQIKRSTVTGRAPNTTSSGNSTYIAAGELAINLTDGKLFSSNGSALITVGSNLDSLSVNSIALTGRITANSSNGTAGQVLASGGSGNVYWATVSGGASLTVSNYTSNAYVNAISNVSQIAFNTSTGISVQDLGSGVGLVSLGSSFKTWNVAGQTSLVAVGEDSVQFIAGNNVTITTNATSIPQQIRFDVAGGGGGANVALTANTSDTQTFFFPMSNATSGSWSNAVMDTTDLFYVPSTGRFSVPSISLTGNGDISGLLTVGGIYSSPVGAPPTVEYLIVAGGGGGGGQYGGGGGAGGLLIGNTAVASATSLSVTVGAGGAGGNSTGRGVSGNNSVFNGLTAIGGGGGGTDSTKSGLSGGSGGGTSINGGSAGTGTVGQGNAGAAADAGGGGGAGGVGTGVAGGPGVQSSISGTATFYAGGGGGWGRSGAEAGGSGVGGVGVFGSTNGTSGAINTGSGGGGGQDASLIPGAGGSGIVIIRYSDTYGTASVTGTATVTVSGGYRTYIFTGSGTITFNNTSTVNLVSTSTNTTTGALVVSGGVGIGGAVYVGGSIYSNGTLSITGNTVAAQVNATSINVSGATTVNGALTVNNTAAVGNVIVTGFINASSYGRFNGVVNATSFNSTGTSTSTFANNVTVTGVTNTVSFNQTGATTSTFANNVTITGVANVTTINVGANVALSTTQLSVGNSSVNTQITAGNVVLNGSTLVVGNTATNVTITGTTSTFRGAVTIANTLSTNGSISLTGNVYTPTTGAGLVGGISGAPYVGYFNGTSYPSISSTSAFNLVGDFTLEAFVYPTYRSSGDWGILDARVNGASPSSWIFAINNGKIQFYNGSSNLGTGTIPLNTWTHIAVVRSGSALNYYINGVLDTARPSFGTGSISPGTTSALIGSKDNGLGASYSTVGSITNLRIVNGTAVYTGNFTVPTGTLTSTQSANPFGGSNTAAITGTVTKLLTLQNSTLIDNSSFGLTITANGVTMSQFSPAPFASASQGTFVYDGATWQSTALTVAGAFSANNTTVTGTLTTTGNTVAAQVNATSINVGANVALSTSQLSVGNSTINAVVTQTGTTWSNSIATMVANTTGMRVGNSTVNTSITSTAITSPATLAIGNTTVTGFANISSTLQVTGNATFTDVTISGNLTTSGTVTYINTTNLNVGDNIITLNADLPGATAPTENAGIEINRGSAANVALRWNETSDVWQFTTDGTTYSTIGTSADAASAYTNAIAFAANASNISNGTLSTARLPATANISTAINVGANVNLSTTTIAVGNSTVNVSASTNGSISLTGNVYTPTNGTGLVGGVTAQGQGYVGSFNGSSQYLTVASNAAFNFGTGDFTLEAWINPTAISPDRFIFSASGSGGLFWGFSSAGDMGWGQVAVSWDYLVSATSVITLNAWNHVALVRSGTSMKMFVNGTQLGATQTNSTSYNISTGSLTIGTQAYYYYSGYISNGRIVKGLAVYTGNFTVPTGPLTATASANPFGGSNTAAITGTQTSLLTLQNSTIIDNSTYGLSITNNGTVTTAQQTVPFGSGTNIGTFLYDGATWQSTALAITGTLTTTGNTVAAQVNATSINVGANVIISSSQLSVGNSTVNVSASTNGSISLTGNVYTPSSGTGLVGGVTGAGGPGYVGSFNGSNQYLTTPSNSVLYFGTGNYTVEAWVYVTSPQTQTYGHQVLGTYDGGGNGWGIIVNRASGGYGIGWLNGSATSILLTTNTYLDSNTWYHIAVVRSGTASNQLKIYQNGVLVATGTDSTNDTVLQTLYIGSQGSTGGFFPGYISNLRIVKGVAVYTGNFTAPTGPLTATASANPFGGSNTSAITGTATSLLTLQNSTIIDNSTYGLTITNTGSVTTAQQTVPFGSGTTIGTFLYDGASTWQSTSLAITGTLTTTGNTVAAQVNATSINVGANVIISTSQLSVGNTTSNAVVTQTGTTWSNSTATMVANTTGMRVGNSTVNTVITSTAITSPATLAIGNTTVTGFANISSTLQVTGSATFTDVTISGNLTTSGTTTYINTTNLNVGDNIITLNADLTGATAPTENAGIEINRGSSANVALRWNETSDVWQFTNDGTTYSTISGTSSFSALTDASNASLTVDEIYLPAITRLNVINNGASSYSFDQYANTNPTIFAISGTTIAFNLNITGHPFLIRTSGGVNYDTGLVHVSTAGVVSLGSSAQGQVAGTLYWKIPESITGNYQYICSVHGGMVGVITITSARGNTALTSGNTTINGTLTTTGNTVAAQVNATALNISGVTSSGNTTVTGFVNASSYGTFGGVVNATSFNSTGTATSTFANNVTITGTANVSAGVNVGANVVLSTTQINVGNSTQNTTISSNNIALNGTLTANASNGSAGQVLTSSGAGNVYWSTVSAGGGANGTSVALVANTSDTQTFYFPMSNVTSGSWANGVMDTTDLYYVPSTGMFSVPSISLTGVLTANASNGTAGQVLTSNGTGVYWSTVAGGGGYGSTLVANTTDTQTFFFPMSNATSGSWSNAVVDSTDLFYVPSTGLFSVPSANVTASLNVVGVTTLGSNVNVTGTVNTTSLSANAISANGITVVGKVTANAVTGTAGQVLTSGGSSGNVYWSTVSANGGGGGAYSGPGITSSATAPATPAVGDFWYVTDLEILSVYTLEDAQYFWLDITGRTIAGTVENPFLINDIMFPTIFQGVSSLLLMAAYD